MEINSSAEVKGFVVNGVNMTIDPEVDANIQPENIKENVNILGVTGTFKGGSLQTKTITIKRNGTTIIKPDSSYYGLAKLEVITEVQAGVSPIYGVSWTNDETTTMTRTDDATEMTYAISNGKIASDFDSVFPFNEMKRTTIDGNVFVYVPAMYFRITKDENNKITGVAVSETQGDGDNWYASKAFYYGAYGASSDGIVLKSVTGVSRQYSVARATARTRANAVGEGYYQRDLYAGTVLMFLWWIEFATKNSSTVMTGSDCNKTTGGTDVFYNETEGESFCVSGYDTSTYQMVWHGIEDYIGNGMEWEDGITGNGTSGGVQYVSEDYTKYNDTGTEMNTLSFNSPTTTGNCLEALGWDDENPFLVQPIATRSDSSYATGFCDYGSTSNNIVSSRGSCYRSDSSYGVSRFARSSVSYSNSYFGCRLLKTS